MGVRWNGMSVKLASVVGSIALVGSLALAGPASASDDATTTTPVTISQTQAEANAISWTEQQMSSTAWDGLCLQLVFDAYSSTGVDLGTEASDTSSAVAFWNSTGLAKYGDGASSPSGALIFWGPTDSNPYGHVAISLGNGQAISSEERDNYGVHIFNISARDAAGYTDLGYVIPA